MPELPLLIFPEPAVESRRQPPVGGGVLVKPSAVDQEKRLHSKFRSIAQSFQTLQTTVQGVEPEQVVVFETIGASVERLAAAAERVPGLEWLAEMDLEDVEPLDGFYDEKRPDKRLSCRLYAVMSNQRAMDQLVSLWNHWCSHPAERAKLYFGPFKQVFIHLKDVRRWSVEDRLAATGVIEYWNEYLSRQQADVRFEVELWCRGSQSARNQAFANLLSIITEAGGKCLAQTAIPEIVYHGVLAQMPAGALRELIDQVLHKHSAQLFRCEDVMFFRPVGQARFPLPTQDTTPLPPRERAKQPIPSGEPVVAVFDGLPLENHALLRDRLLVDDPDGHSARYQPQQQQHGTAMASLIVHGDLCEDGDALPRPVYLRPVFLPSTDFEGNHRENTPDDQLLVDLIHRCVRRLKEADGDSPPIAPSVSIINLSLADPYRPFDRELSPLARLLDWLAWKYQVLFLVSVGNHADPITISATCDDWRSLDRGGLLRAALHGLSGEQAKRRPLSPAEAINVVTVGAVHADSSDIPAGDRRIDLLQGDRLPSPLNSVASGFNRAVKPEILFPGGRQLFHQPIGSTDEGASFAPYFGFRPPGQLVGVPGVRASELDRTAFCRGTSNATALASRCAALVYERLRGLRTEPGGDRLDEQHIAVLIKALIVHGASWGNAAQTVRNVFQNSTTDWREMQRLQARFLGYGEVNAEKSLFCTPQRATMIGWATLGSGEGHVFRLPLPPSLSGSRQRRRLTITLAWISPINPRHKNYRHARLWFYVPEDALGVAKAELDSETSQRGTVEHRVFQGERVKTFIDDETLSMKVNCMEHAGKLTDRVPYALAVTLEVAESLDLPIYNEIRDRIRPIIEIEPEAS